MKSVLKLAFPTMIQKLLSFGTWFIFFALVEHMGETPIAVSGIVRSVYMLVMIPVFAFGATANTLTSRLIGEGKQNEVMPTVFKTIGQGLIAILPVLLCCLFIQMCIRDSRYHPGSTTSLFHSHDRSQFQRDYDRLIFSSPFRRLQNKTQVFPLPGNIFVHNRLTHSLERASRCV